MQVEVVVNFLHDKYVNIHVHIHACTHTYIYTYIRNIRIYIYIYIYIYYTYINTSSTQYLSVVRVSSTSSMMSTRFPRTCLPTPLVSSNHCTFFTTYYVYILYLHIILTLHTPLILTLHTSLVKSNHSNFFTT